uniref:Odorant receptor n=1 Tax=Yemma signatus TaxID=300820 RepID=A0A385H5E7_9HEMI|nr:odorant receptor [Yemma signatus]
MWDWRQLRWLNYFGWWPWEAKTQRAFLISRFFGFLCYFIDFIEMGPEVAQVIIASKSGSMGPVIFNINQTLVGVQWAAKVATVYSMNKQVQDMVKRFQEMDKRGRALIGDKEVDEMSKYWEFRCYLTTLLVPISMTVSTLWLLRPIVYLFLGQWVHILDAWTPFDSSNVFGWLINYVLQGVHVMTAIWGLVVFDSLMCCFLQMLHLQFDVLKKALERLLYNGSEKQLTRCIIFHQEILRLGKDINSIFKYLILLQSIISTLVICLSIFEFSKTDGSIMKRINTLLLSGCQAYECFLYSWLCEELESQNIEVIRAAYRSNWHEASLKERRKLIFLMARSQKPQLYGMVVIVNTAFFLAVIKTSFSYYQFLATMV